MFLHRSLEVKVGRASSVAYVLVQNNAKSTAPHVFGSIGRARWLYQEVAERALDPQAIFPDGLQVRAPRNERNLVVSLREQSTIVAPQPAGSDHRNSHPVPL